METIFQLLAALAVLAGTSFSVIAMVGLVRLPDVYTRLHAAGKVGVFGVVFLVVAAVFLTPLGIGKGLVLIVLLVIGGPVTTHAISSAAYRVGIALQRVVRNDLADDNRLPVVGSEPGQRAD
jgi:multicomponent Na+:H+ antiporter subunit G